MSNFQKMTLKAAGVTLIDCVHKTPKAQDTGFPYIAIPQMKEGRIDLDGVRLISKEDLEAWTIKAKPQPFDVILSRRCNPGVTVVVPSDLECALGQNLVLLRSDNSVIHTPFLRWLVKGPEWWNQVNTFINVGAIFDSLKCADIPKFELSIPSKESQVKITNILSSLDNKIELNQQINTTLEAMAQALFKSWFVDFDPVKAKIAAKETDADTEGMTLAAMEAISGQNAEALAQMAQREPALYAELKETAELFPDTLVESELGEIPDGWSINNLGDVSNKVSMGPFGSNLKRDNFIDFGVPIIRGGNLTNGFVDEGFVYVSEEKAETVKNSIAYREDIVITHRGTLGQIGIIPNDSRFSKYIVSQSQLLISIDKKQICPHYIYQFLCSRSGQHQLLSNISQTGVPAIARPTNSVKAIDLVIPSFELNIIFEKNINALISKKTFNDSNTRTLIELRDSLLPKLLSGEVSVSDV
jgi:type I restriction enzyme S subunit